ncbi:MAG: DUF2752 domain-containing protein [Candidatus Poribacteria bacterium]|nr:DUF2752 domain-containing protein [Candidatus Poribacteria bacterium]
MLQSRRRELTLVGLFVWYILSVGVFIILLLPFVVPQHQLAQFIPECTWQSQFQKPCAFCGMSTAFYAISRGDFAQAHHLNPLSLYIYFTFLLNTLCAVITLKRNTRFLKNIGAMPHNDNVLS